MKEKKEYIGDGVYASFDGFQIWLETDRGSIVHEIALDSSTFNSLEKYVKNIGFKNV